MSISAKARRRHPIHKHGPTRGLISYDLENRTRYIQVLAALFCGTTASAQENHGTRAEGSLRGRRLQTL
jgi:hypothetical protein